MSDRPKFDPFTGAQITTRDPDATQPRLGVPPEKFGMKAIPVLTEQAQAVMIMLFPPEALRDQPLDVIEQAIALQGQGILKSIALEIYKTYTSDPLDATGTQNTAEILANHAAAMRKMGRG